MTTPAWADAEWSPFGVALEPVIEPEPVVEFGVAKAPVDDDVYLPLGSCPIDGSTEPGHAHTADEVAAAFDHTPELDDTGAPVIEWEPATREQLADGDTVRVTQVGRWKGTRLVGKTTHYERKTSA